MATARGIVARMLGATTLLLLGAALLFVPLAEATPTWLAPTAVSDSTEQTFESHAAIDETGDAVAVWAAAGTPGAIEAAVRPAGGEWSAHKAISTPGATAAEPQVAISPAGEAIAVWESLEASSFAIDAATWTPATGWSAPEALSEEGGFVTADPQIAISPAGEAVATWERSDGGGQRVEVTSRPAGGGWSPREKLSESGTFATQPRVAINAAGAAVAIWEAGGSMMESSLRPAGSDWDPVETVGFAVTPPSVAISPNGEPVAVWIRFMAGSEVVEAASEPAGGGAWSPGKLLTPSGTAGNGPHVTINGAGEATAVWGQAQALGTSIESASRPAGGEWAAGPTLSTEGTTVSFPDLVGNAAGEAVAAWPSAKTGGLIVEAAERDAAGRWSAPVPVSQPGLAGSAEVAINADGEGIADWLRPDPTDNTVEIAPFDRLGPALSGVTIPSSGTVGQSLSFSAAALDNWSALGRAKWDFGDGGQAQGLTATHAFAAPGSYKVTLTAPDALGNVTTASGTVTIPGAPDSTPPKPSPTPTHKIATAGRIVKFKGKVATLRLSCPGPAATSCQGVAKLTAKAGKKTMALAGQSFSVPGGKTAAVKLRLLASIPPKGVAAKLSGRGLAARTVVLKP